MKKAVKVSLIVVSVIILLFAAAIGAFFIVIEPDIKIFGSVELDVDKLTSYSRTVTLYDKNGVPINDALYDKNKIYVRYDELPADTVNAFIAIEDKRFYSHGGVDYKRLASATLSNIRSRNFREGASTITQQLIKNTHLSNEKTVKRKLNEIRLARKLERIMSKEQILEGYFNILYFGAGIHGLGTASRVMFGKPASELTLAQSAALASIINNPTKYSPYKNPQNLKKRKDLILREMYKQGFIDEQKLKIALAEDPIFNKEKKNQFVLGALKSACNRLECPEKELFIDNLEIYTEYDGEISRAAQEIINDNEGDYMIRILVLDNASGAVVCDETNRTGYIDPRRSPASAIKPFLSYAPALENGANTLTQILDEPTSFGDYSPRNYKNVYRGYISLEDCLIHSSNIAAVKLLCDNGIDCSKRIAGSFGLPFTDGDDGPTIALGGMERGVTLLELANAYRTIANGGVYSPVSYVRSVCRPNGAKYSVNTQAQRVVGDDTAYLLTEMLQKCAREGTAKTLKYSGNIAAKTGTNGDANGNTDCYCVAYTPKNTVAVWFGADKTQIKNSITGASCCGVVAKLCEKVLDTGAGFVMPDSVDYFDIDATELSSSHEVYLADPFLPKRYTISAPFAKRHLPVRRQTDIIDYYDSEQWFDE